MRVSVECFDPQRSDRKVVEENFLKAFFRYKPRLAVAYAENSF